MGNRNQHLEADIRGMENPITFNSDYGARGMVEQLRNAISFESTNPEYHRLFLDEMSPVCRNSLYFLLSELMAAQEDSNIVSNPGDPFAATTGWADSGAEAANSGLSAAGDRLVSTITGGGEGALNVYTTLTTVVGVRYRATVQGIAIETGEGALVASNATALTSPIASADVEDEDSIGEIEFEATATTTYVGLVLATTPASGEALSIAALHVRPIVPVNP